MKTILAILVISSALICTQASPNSVERIECFIQGRIFENRIRTLLENLKQQLINGIPEYNIPPLDPLVFDNFSLSYKNPYVTNLNVTMNGKIDGLMNWNLTDVSLSLAGFKFNLGFSFPEIKGKGTYNMNGTLSNVLPVYGHGDFDFLVRNLSIKLNGQIGSTGSGDKQRIFLKNFGILLSLGHFTFEASGIMDDEKMSFLVSQLITQGIPDLIEKYPKQINEVVSSEVTTFVDSLLVNKTINDLLGFLNPKSTFGRVFKLHCGDY